MISVPILCTGTPPSERSFHACAVVGEFLYIHGGLDKKNSVLSSLYRFSTISKRWECVESNFPCSKKKSVKLPALEPCDSPNLSHHCAVPYAEKFILLVGGWNGKKRTSDVFVFDTEDHSWSKMPVFGEIPVGLSSHTVTLISDREILVLGREGGVHTHRRSGDAFTLNPVTGEYKQATYGVESRSGHTANLVRSSCKNGFTIFVYSGRKTGRQISFVGFWSKKCNSDYAASANFATNLKGVLSKCPAIDTPEGRQNSQAVCVDDQIITIYGGQLWQARDFVSSEVFAYNTLNMTWHKLPQVSPLPKLTGFTMGVGSNGLCYIFGGSDGKICNNNLWSLQIS